MNKFEKLRNLLQEVADLKGAIGLMAWDQEVMMPKGGIALRARQISTLSGMQHEMFVQEGGKLLEQVSPADEAAFSDFEKANLAMIRYDHGRMTKVPTELVKEMQFVASEAQHAWEQARKASDFSVFEPALSRITALKIREADCLGFDKNPYDAHLETYEPGARADALEQLFSRMRAELQGLVNVIQQAPQVDDEFIMQSISPEKQLAFSEAVVAKMGYDFSIGRQDISTHPFTIGLGSLDVRITTRVKENDVTEMLYSSIHEGGHALYEQGIPYEHYGLPAGEFASIGIHESQSRIWENNVGRSLAFWTHFFPDLAALYPGRLKGKGPEDVFKAVNKVQPSFIRTAADELTYHFHIMLRFEIENLLLNQKVKVKELPELWNSRMKDYLGLEVKNPVEGVLQDVHWSHGSFGYFPTYSLGSFYAAQMMAQARRELPGLEKQFETGEFGVFRNWLKQKVHEKGKVFFPEKLCEIVTGEPLNVKYFIDYAKEKFGRVYGISL